MPVAPNLNMKYRFFACMTILLSGVNIVIFAQPAKEQSNNPQVILAPENPAVSASASAQNNPKASEKNNWKSALLTEFEYNPPPEVSNAAPPAPVEADVVMMEKYTVVAQKDKKFEIKETKTADLKSFNNMEGGTLMRYEGKRVTTEICINPQEDGRFFRLFRLSW
jgi:hypothetical protein